MGVQDKLREIMEWKRLEIAPRVRDVPEAELARLNASLPKPIPFIAALRRPDGKLAVIAEIKRKSPSARASGRSVPCLRKDFMVHPIQVLEARQSGASAILIIVRALDDDEISRLHGAANAAGLDALFEVHAEGEIGRAEAHGARAIGVNNRDLAIFKTDLGLSERLIGKFPKGVVAVSESGISTAADAARAKRAGAHAVLVGEALMRAPDAAALVASFHGA